MNKKTTQSVSAILLFLIALAYGWIKTDSEPFGVESEFPETRVHELFQQRISGEMVSVQGNVVKILPDDNDGNRHQRFIVQLDNSLTLLVAHNIDLAARVPLRLHDNVEIHGQYEWNNKGGLLHWTHHDPAGIHPAGWIRYQGNTYH